MSRLSEWDENTGLWLKQLREDKPLCFMVKDGISDDDFGEQRQCETSQILFKYAFINLSNDQSVVTLL